MVRAFSPDERCLGGVAEIHAEYANMRRKLLGAQPQVETYFYDALTGPSRPKSAANGVKAQKCQHVVAPSYAVAAADRLSFNRQASSCSVIRDLPIAPIDMVACRACKLAASDGTMLNHVRNVYHMHRRMSEVGRREQQASSHFSSAPHVYGRSNRNSLAYSLNSWTPRPLFRPQTAAARGTRLSLLDPTTPLPKQGPLSPYQRLEETSVGSPPHGAYHTQRLRSSYTAYKIALLGEIIDRQLFEQRQLLGLFQAYLDHNSIADMPVVKMVIADLKVELQVK